MLKNIVDALIGSEEHFKREQAEQQQRTLHDAYLRPVRIGGILGLIQKIQEVKDADAQSGGGAGSRRR